jgi:hypothetical protein
MVLSDLEGGGMETLCKNLLESGKSVLESGATVQQLVAAHREALNTIGRDVTVTLDRCTLLNCCIVTYHIYVTYPPLI